MLWSKPAMDEHPIHRRVEILLLHATETGDKYQPDTTLGSYADLTMNEPC